jgi:enoyl-CoA hydratase/carnithine racemase
MILPTYDTLVLSQPDEHLLVITINRPDVMNAISTQVGRDLHDCWSRLTADAQGVRCAVITGAGDRAFCAGGDLKDRNGMTDATWQAQHELFERGFVALLDCPVPVIAAVNGAAFGGGLELALSCDFIYADREARFALTECRIGIMPGTMGTQNLPRAVGERRAKELILSAQPFSATEAYEWGMVNRLCDPGTVVTEALAAAQRIGDCAPLSVRQAKKSIHFGLQTDLHTAYRLELEAYYRLLDTEDRREGIAAFNEKRKPQFKGR